MKPKGALDRHDEKELGNIFYRTWMNEIEASHPEREATDREFQRWMGRAQLKMVRAVRKVRREAFRELRRKRK